MSVTIKRENWNGRYVYVARENGRIVSRIQQRKTKFNKAQLQEIYQRNNTFRKDIQRTTTTLTNVREVVYEKQSSLEQRNKRAIIKRPRGRSLYQVSGLFKGKTIVARSNFDSENPKKEAWENFILRISEADNPNVYDEQAGLDALPKVTNIREGWVFYAKK